jgi:hypothetical protein
MALFAVSAPADDAAGGTDVRLQPIVEKIETKRITATDRYNFIDIPFPKCFSPNERKIGNLDLGCAREQAPFHLRGDHILRRQGQPSSAISATRLLT